MPLSQNIKQSIVLCVNLLGKLVHSIFILDKIKPFHYLFSVEIMQQKYIFLYVPL